MFHNTTGFHDVNAAVKQSNKCLLNLHSNQNHINTFKSKAVHQNLLPTITKQRYWDIAQYLGLYRRSDFFDPYVIFFERLYTKIEL